MTTVTQQPLPFGTVDADTASLLTLIDGDPLHAHDRAAVVDAIVAAASDNDGRVDPNVVRARLDGQVYPPCIGPTYLALCRAGVLKADGWVISDDTHGRNVGKPARAYRLVNAAAAHE